jgi:hypothetical protein
MEAAERAAGRRGELIAPLKHENSPRKTLYREAKRLQAGSIEENAPNKARFSRVSTGTSDALAPLERSGIPLLRTWQRGAVHIQWRSDRIIADGFLDDHDQPTLRHHSGGKTQ